MSCKDTSGNWDASAFVSFNHGAIGVPPATLISSIDPNIYAMSGFAWSKSSGWIAFNVGPDPVKYNRLTGLFSGFAWSKNLGYISMAGLKMVAQVPKLNLNPQNIVAANHSGTLDLLTSSGVIDGLDVYILVINRWDSDDADTYANIPSLSGSFTDVDIRRVRISTDLLKVYNYKLNDPFGNSSTGALTVVANTPTSTMDPSGNTIGTGTVTGDPMKLLST